MFNHLSGATRLFPIIGDPIKYVESPMRLTRTFGARDYNTSAFLRGDLLADPSTPSGVQLLFPQDVGDRL
jgi:hypothetical protein